MNQLDTVIRPDKAVQISFGRGECASSSEVQRLLDRCVPETVSHLQQANGQMYQQHGQALRHDFSQEMLLVDLDLTGLVASQRAEGSLKGYFAKSFFEFNIGSGFQPSTREYSWSRLVGFDSWCQVIGKPLFFW